MIVVVKNPSPDPMALERSIPCTIFFVVLGSAVPDGTKLILVYPDPSDKSVGYSRSSLLRDWEGFFLTYLRGFAFCGGSALSRRSLTFW